MMVLNNLRWTLLASAVSFAFASPAMAVDTTITATSGNTTPLSVGGTDHVVVDADAVWEADDTVIKWKNPSTALVIDNAGVIRSTEDDGRAFNASGDGTATRYLILNNLAGATIEAQNDAFRINTDFTEGTVVVNNAGTVQSTVDGQALDFDAFYGNGTSSASITINNLSGGVIRSADADAIRPGEGAVINNAGTIYANGNAGEKNDGIDFQAHAGTVVNLAGGLISGQRHGITSDTNVDVYNAAGATIIGRNGSGVGSDGNGKVVNYGTITGAYDGSGTGDGDGVDIDYYGEVENWGLIQGTGAAGYDSTGNANISEGIVITVGGKIYNHASGVITGIRDGITAFNTFEITNEGRIDGGNAGIAFIGNSTLTNSGTITSDNEAVWYGAGSTATLINSGVISGTNYAVHFAEGNDTLVIDQGSSIKGLVDGGDGYDTLWLRGGTFDSARNFEYLHVTGSAVLAGDNEFSTTLLEGTLQLGTGGSTGSLGNGNVVDNGLLRVNRADTMTLANNISGTGGVEQIGAGTTVLTGINTYTGPTRVLGGSLVIGVNGQGSITGDAVVGSGAAVRGTGSIGGNLAVQTGGTLVSGNAAETGALRVGGNVDLQTGATVRIDSAEDGVRASGRMTIASGTMLAIASATAVPIGAEFAALSAEQGVTGQFDGIVVNGTSLHFLTPDVTYDSHNVIVDLKRNDVALASVATTHDERATANAIDALALTNPVATAVLQKDAAAAQKAVSELSGTQFADTRSAIINDSRALRSSIDRHMMGFDDISSGGRAVARQDVTTWTSAYGLDRSESRGTSPHLTSSATGLIVGADLALEDSHLGAVIGREQGNARIRSLASSSQQTRTDVGIYGDTLLDHWRVRGAVTYSGLDVDTTRHVEIDTTPSRLTSKFDANVTQAFVEAGYHIDLGPRQWLEPFATVSRVRLDTDRASEGNATGALDIAGRASTVNSLSLGLHHAIALGASGRTQVHGSIAWQGTSGDTDTESVQRFAGASGEFTVLGTPIARQAAAIEAGLDVALSARSSLGASYTGLFASHAREQGGRIQLTVQL
ncbi:autotransporter domain-containing protein [Luteibacter aegosomaticola]|uniref:autotransporter outer membrane beta-barrel domain-containing protein n=1 Tax=Luteibacter aegosomaticola TaxID=2911538 RepID=UPI001FF86621|nr:autotransporter domain-containing protein [Luteibacter aegosomaticola]UPG91118.1 autotransporter domain-containing protein [Luteibacter aegosomaticola]